MDDADTVYTYIIQTGNNEFYCGKTKNIEKRLREHRVEKKPSWFSFNHRQNFNLLFVFKGDFERYIKRAGIKKFVECLNTQSK